MLGSRYFYKGSLSTSFIILVLIASSSFAFDSSVLFQEALEKKLDSSPQWQSLLHAKGGQQNISDDDFILSTKHFSLRAELRKSIDLLFSDSAFPESICRFPARYLWLSKYLDIPAKNLSFCTGFKEFTEKAPMTDLYLVYASENLVSTSSMMGHILLKMSGINDSSKSVSHSLSFFTEVKGFNFPKLLIDSLVLGKDGYFALNPYKEKERIYLEEEQRNIWTYHLAFSDWQKQLLQAHLWELKDTKLTYFFHDYNCATFTLYALAVADPRFLDFISSIDSPIDVAKAAKKLDLIDSTTLMPSNKWKTRMLNDALPSDQILQTKAAVNQLDLSSLALPESSPQEIYLKNELANTYAHYLFEEEELTSEELKKVEKQVNVISKELNQEFFIDLSDYKDPLKSQEDTQIYSGIVSIEGEQFLQLGFLAAAKKREDDSRQYFGETDLRLFDLSVLISFEDKQKIKVDDFSLYSVSALMPRDPLTGGISGRFDLGAKTHFNDFLESGTAFDISGGLGLSFQVTKDILVYSLLNAGYGLRAGRSYFYTEPEMGFVVNEVFDMKSILSFHHIYNQEKSGDAYFKLKFNQSLFLNSRYGTFLGYERVWKKSLEQERFDIRLKYYF